MGYHQFSSGDQNEQRKITEQRLEGHLLKAILEFAAKSKDQDSAISNYTTKELAA